MCRMYTTWHEGVNGFAKNVVEFFGGNPFVAVLFALMTLAGVFLIPFSLGWGWLLFYLLLVLLIRIFISLTSIQDIGKNLKLHLLQMGSFLYIVIKGINVKLTGRYEWKGRTTGGQS